MKAYAKVWGRNDKPKTIGTLFSYLPNTLENRRRLRNKLFLQYPKMNFFKITNE